MEEPDLRQQKLDNQVKEQLLHVLDVIWTDMSCYASNWYSNNNELKTAYIYVNR